MLAELVAVLRHFGELVIDEDTAALLMSMSVATIDRHADGHRYRHRLDREPLSARQDRKMRPGRTQ